MAKMSAEDTKALVLKAFDTLFNKRDYAKAAGFWSDNYIQHSAHIPPGRDGLFNLIRSLPDTLRYENAHMPTNRPQTNFPSPQKLRSATTLRELQRMT